MADQEKILQAAKAEIESAMNKAFENVAGSNAAETEESSEEKPKDYVEPIQDPYGKAIKYLEKHNVMQLFQALTASIVYNKPEDPLQTMMKEIETMKKQAGQ
ncbi:uncharacterized protein LOC143069151 [Mytilus galloprovincialis]|uniref:uncharacterized protein LOC143069151 n=1 Tax=Mytilus galloprovincialis TaxID=29158 RepID=UPI003F7C21F7